MLLLNMVRKSNKNIKRRKIEFDSSSSEDEEEDEDYCEKCEECKEDQEMLDDLSTCYLCGGPVSDCTCYLQHLIDSLSKKVDEFEKEQEKQQKTTTVLLPTPKSAASSKRVRIKEIKKITAKDFILNKIDHNVNNLDDLIQILSSPNAIEEQTNLINALKELKEMIGMNTIKEQIINQILFFIQDLLDKGTFLHSVITGSPGCGKSSIIVILAKIYKSLGFLSSDKVVKADRVDLIGEYLGHTAVKTKKVLESAKGGILLIDEAYSLGSEDNRDSFAKECVDTINQYLSEHVDEFICILAGYEEQIENYFFKQNPGLKRRFQWKFNIPNYSPPELCEIFHKQSTLGGWRIDLNKEYVTDKIKENLKYFDENGGGTRAFLDRCKILYARRNFKDLKYEEIITGKPAPIKRKRNGGGENELVKVREMVCDKLIIKEDFDKALEEFKTSRAHALKLCKFCKEVETTKKEEQNCTKCIETKLCGHCKEKEFKKGEEKTCVKCMEFSDHSSTMYS